MSKKKEETETEEAETLEPIEVECQIKHSDEMAAIGAVMHILAKVYDGETDKQGIEASCAMLAGVFQSLNRKESKSEFWIYDNDSDENCPSMDEPKTVERAMESIIEYLLDHEPQKWPIPSYTQDEKEFLEYEDKFKHVDEAVIEEMERKFTVHVARRVSIAEIVAEEKKRLGIEEEKDE